ncbi:pentatricopeptide repeat-containing protein At4g21190 isoform X2 [Punica granatum]|uniref:Pentatricopeptide repeat-containing protein At4g21190 isoform X2 n=1 Tax=Punica granatum TaxID=22663 RepID=A0A6P8D0G8_PUNGR|nr:pentatricopeptide repeat-containing protein At4g21190 isoform X2 [Punica granatum]XP_031389856.1 pentatricopeptide repeat-containing protein At4g21190 isoform X2 [Punica granatum]
MRCGPRPRYPRVWKSRKRIGTVSKSAKLVECVKGLSNVKEEVYGALDSFIAWELEFPVITVKKALKTLEKQNEWKRIIQVTKWMLSKGQGRTMGSYFTLLNALAEDGRLDEAEELWNKIFSDSLEATPRIFFDKMISVYHKRGMHEKMFEIFADMEELGVRPTVSTVSMMGKVFQQLGMLDKYDKLNKKYPPPKWEYRYIKGKRVRVRSDKLYDSNSMRRAQIGNGDGASVDLEQLNEQESGEEEITEDEGTSSDRGDKLPDESNSISNQGDERGETL